MKTNEQIGTIEGRNDLSSGVSEFDLTTAKTNLSGKCYTSISFSSDGKCILAAGKSSNICIYNVKEGILLKKFIITQNHSLDGLDEFINRRNVTEFGNKALVEQREELEGGNVTIRLPGVVKGDMASRSHKPEINVFSVKFSPTGQTWAAATTEGLMVYSLNKGIVFDPFNLSIEVTPKATRELVLKQEYSAALIMALKLNEQLLIQEVLEQIPFNDSKYIAIIFLMFRMLIFYILFSSTCSLIFTSGICTKDDTVYNKSYVNQSTYRILLNMVQYPLNLVWFSTRCTESADINQFTSSIE